MPAYPRLHFPLMILLACVGIGLANPAAAQTLITQNTTTRDTCACDQSILGQSFTATVSGTVTEIRVVPVGNGDTVVRLYNGETTSEYLGIGSPVSSQPVSLASNAGEFQSIVLPTPLSVTAGSVYSFAFDLGKFAAAPGASYAGGTYFREGTYTAEDLDLKFIVVQQAAMPVPTLSDWAMILLGLALAGAAAAAIQRRYREG